MTEIDHDRIMRRLHARGERRYREPIEQCEVERQDAIAAAVEGGRKAAERMAVRQAIHRDARFVAEMQERRRNRNSNDNQEGRNAS